MFVLACGPSGGELLALFVLFIGLPAFLVGSILSRWAVRALARSEQFIQKPLSLFIAAVELPVCIASLICTGFLMCCHVDSVGLFGFLSVLTVTALSAIAILWTIEPHDETPPSTPRPTAKLWLQDLLVAAFSFGAWLMLLMNHPSLHRFDKLDFTLYAAVLFVLEAAALALSMELCRYSALGQNAISRAVVFTLGFVFTPLLFPVLAPAWWIWRRARANARMPSRNTKDSRQLAG